MNVFGAQKVFISLVEVQGLSFLQPAVHTSDMKLENVSGSFLYYLLYCLRTGSAGTSRRILRRNVSNTVLKLF